LETGDAVKYTPSGALISGGLNDTGTFFVRKLDDFTIKLYATHDEAIGAGAFADRDFAPGAVDATNDTITVAGSGYAENTALTYRAPPPLEFRSQGVDVSISGNTATPTDNNQIFIENHHLSTGDKVFYQVQPGGTPIGGLTSGTAYFVIRIDANNIQLAATRDATDPDDVETGFREGVFTAVKMYPANATTNSNAGRCTCDTASSSSGGVMPGIQRALPALDLCTALVSKRLSMILRPCDAFIASMESHSPRTARPSRRRIAYPGCRIFTPCGPAVRPT
jgi:hypothetical protein